MLDPADATPEEPVFAGWMAEFDSDHAAVRAAEALRRAGHPILDAYAPRPVERLEHIVAPLRSTLPRASFFAGTVGAATGLFVEWLCNGWIYPLNVGGRPPFGLPAFIPIAFETMVLFAAFATFFTFMHRGALPWLSHPAFQVPGFERASIDRFWLLVGATGEPADDEADGRLKELGALSVFAVEPERRSVAPVTSSTRGPLR
jgi:hypothetical protein